MLQDKETVSNPKKIVNIFNDYFSTIAPTSSDEIPNLILLLNKSKSVGTNGLQTKILKLLKNDISLQFANIFNISFSTGVFPF